jgi:hypothetical protein
MANRWANQFNLTLEKRVTDIFAQVTFGASGAPTLNVANSKGVLSVTRNSAGTFTFVFGSTPNGRTAFDTYVKVLQVAACFNSGAAAPAAPGLYIKANNIAVANTASIQIVLTVAGGGTATDPASGEIGYFDFTFGDSTAP